MPWIRTGTVSVTQNSTTVTGTSTKFVENGRVGDGFIGPDGVIYEVTNLASNTALAISPPYKGPTAAGGTYALVPIQGYNKDTADALRQASLEVGGALDGLEESVQQAADSASSALSSKNAAATSETNAAQSASGALSSKNAAASSETAAGQSASAALSSKNAAGASETNAAQSASAALASKNAAATSEANAASSASTAANTGTGKAFIEGLIPSWNSATSITLSGGSAYIPSLNRNITLPAPLTLSGLSLTANTWYYLYLYDNAGTPAIELVTTAPAAPYLGSARTKNGDTTRRFMGAFRAIAANALARFSIDPTGMLNYTGANQGTPYRILSAGTATSNTIIDASSMVPPTTRLGKFQLFNLGTITAVFYPADSPSLNYGNMGAGNRESGALIPLDASQRLGYYNDGSSGGLFYVDVQGYGMDR